MAITVNYRLVPHVRWPVGPQDVRCALAHVRANAAVYGIDPNRVAALGYSAGDVLSTGTVSGVAGFSEDAASLYLRPGDVMEAEGRVRGGIEPGATAPITQFRSATFLIRTPLPGRTHASAGPGARPAG